MNQPGATAYREHGILTASPARLVAMLCEKAIASLHQAIEAIERKDIEGRWRANRRATEIIEHLLATLDHDKGGEIAANLDRLYVFMLRHLLNVDLKNDPAPARDVIRLIEPLHRSWIELDKQMAFAGAANSPSTIPSRSAASAMASPAGDGSDLGVGNAPRVIASA